MAQELQLLHATAMCDVTSNASCRDNASVEARKQCPPPKWCDTHPSRQLVSGFSGSFGHLDGGSNGGSSGLCAVVTINKDII